MEQGTRVDLPRVSVILSTYNGEHYLPEFLRSLQIQQGVDITLIYRDDGSSDRSVEIINKSNIPMFRCHCFPGRLGPAESFSHLTEHILPQGFVAFADQDDIWLPGKLKVAVERLVRDNSDLYFSSVLLGDSDKIWPQPEVEIDPLYACFENLAKGCTIVMTMNGLTNFLNHIKPAGVMHDHWAYFMNLHLGKVSFDSNPQVIYRIHAHNAVGHKIKKRLMDPRRFLPLASHYLFRSIELINWSEKLENRETINFLKLVERKISLKNILEILTYKSHSSRLVTLVIYIYLKRV